MWFRCEHARTSGAGFPVAQRRKVIDMPLHNASFVCGWDAHSPNAWFGKYVSLRRMLNLLHTHNYG